MKMYIKFSFMIITYNILFLTSIIIIIKIISEGKPWYTWLILIIWIILWGIECAKCTKDFIEAKKEYSNSKDN